MKKTKWILDPTHSELGFKIKHLMITNVSGSFGNFSVEAEMQDEDFKTAEIEVLAELSSISTNNEQRDAHLRTADFFEAEKYPQLKFMSTKIEALSGEEYNLYGDLTIKDVTKPVKLKVEFGGAATDPWGNEKAGFVITGKINRNDWGISFNSTLETGGLLLGDEVRIFAETQLVKQEEEVAV